MGDGSDSFAFSDGDGNDIIEDNGAGDTDRVIFDGFDSLDATFTQDNGDDLIVSFANGESVTVINGLGGSFTDNIEIFEFDDVSLTISEIIDMLPAVV